MPAPNDPERLTRRLERLVLAIALFGSAALQLHSGWRWSLGFLIGAAASWWNFRGLRRLTTSLGTSAAPHSLENAAWILARFVALVLGAFVILRFTQISVYAAFAGLFASAGAVILEAILELTYER